MVLSQLVKMLLPYDNQTTLSAVLNSYFHSMYLGDYVFVSTLLIFRNWGKIEGN